MNREPFQPLAFPLEGLRLIEASAGTGKTFSLAGIYLRLLVEKRLDVRDVLVMTYTRAATQELRERIRSRIAGAADIADDPTLADPGDTAHQLAMALTRRAAKHGEPREQLARRLRQAAARMDDATITTIHGFAQQAAEENAFDSGLPFDRGTQVDDPAIQLDAVTDYWRSQVLGQPTAKARAFVELWAGPRQLYDQLKEALQRPYLAIRQPAGGDLAALTRNARRLWDAEYESLRDLLRLAFDQHYFLKNKPLYKVARAYGSADAMMDRLEDCLGGTVAGYAVMPGWVVELTSDARVAYSVKVAGRKAFRTQDLPLTRALAELASSGRVAALEAAFGTVSGIVRERKREHRQFSFADMIDALHQAIIHPLRGDTLAASLHRTWKYALVDEFQDTDPLQYDILKRIYQGRSEGALIMIGDPKQAIFAFRGGDVFAYLQAAEDAQACYELATNYRSSQGVLDGIQALFRGPAAAAPEGEFLVPDIRLQTVRSGREPDDLTLVRGDALLPPVTVWPLPAEAKSLDQVRAAVIGMTVSEICGLLEPATGARARRPDGTETPVQAKDIAVLVNRNDDAAELQRALARRGVGAVCLHRASVFESDQAADLLYVLRAADAAARPETIRAALATPLFGLRMADLIALTEDDSTWHQRAEALQKSHETWRSRGVYAMLEPLLQEAAPRILALQDGERRMTNYLQLAELLTAAESETFGFAGLIHWLTHQIAHPQPEAEVDSQQLKLESDDELVRITTVHRAKGLEYQIVLAPFTVSLGARELRQPWIFHDPAGRAWLDFSIDDSSRPIAAIEARAEALRLLYVALTRARQACYLTWGAANGAQNSALAWLLHANDGVTPGEITPSRSVPPWLTTERTRARLTELAERAAGSVQVVDPPEPLAEGFRRPAGNAPAGAPRRDLPTPRPDWSVFSFSRLVAGGKHRVPAGGADDETLELGLAPDPALPEPAAVALNNPVTLRGPTFGTAVHNLLEGLTDPADWHPPDTLPDATHHAMAAWHLQNAGLALGDGSERQRLLDGVCRMISRTLHTPLPGIGPLARIPAERRLAEMEFYLGLGGERVGRLLELLADYGYHITLPPERANQTLNGLMQGYIDLTVEADGRYYVIDYKTNDLGPDRSAYQGEALDRAVRSGRYDLQYLIYLVALHRHLRSVLTGYQPAQHLGGACYLFLRGLDGTSSDSGVFVDSPAAELIETLDDLFRGPDRTGMPGGGTL